MLPVWPAMVTVSPVVNPCVAVVMTVGLLTLDEMMLTAYSSSFSKAVNALLLAQPA